jgi:hypothetical protein
MHTSKMETVSDLEDERYQLGLKTFNPANSLHDHSYSRDFLRDQEIMKEAWDQYQREGRDPAPAAAEDPGEAQHRITKNPTSSPQACGVA